MNSKKFSDNILETIKLKKIKPKSKWQFYFKNIFIWLLAFLSLLLSSLSFAVMIFLLKNIDLSVSKYLRLHPLENLLQSLPYFWILFLILLIFIIYYQVKQTKKGYLYPLWLITISAFLISVIFGLSFSLLGLGEKIDNALSYKTPFYSQIFNPQMQFWTQAEEGRLAGLLIAEDSNYYLIDKENNVWLLQFNENANIFEKFLNMPVRVLGEVIFEYEFRVDRIMPLGPGRGMFERPCTHHDSLKMEKLNCNIKR